MTNMKMSSGDKIRPEDNRHGLIWSVLSHHQRPAGLNLPPCLGGDLATAEYSRDGEIIFIADSHPPYILFAVDRKYKILWKHEGMDIRALDYSFSRDRLLGYGLVNKKPVILEFNAKNGRVCNTLEKTEKGPLGHPFAAVYNTGSIINYDPLDDKCFWLADSEHHAVFCVSWKGKIRSLFGSYGTSGCGEQLLCQPVTVSAGASWGERVLVSDWGNNRVVQFNVAKNAMELQLPFPYPYSDYVNSTAAVAVFNSANPTHHWYGVFILSDNLVPVPRFHIPQNTNMVASHPRIPFRFLLSWDQSVYEIDYRDAIYRKSLTSGPIQNWLFDNTLISPDKPLLSVPIVDWFRVKKSIVIRSSVSAKIRLEAAEFSSPGTSCWNGRWTTVAEFEVSGKAALLMPVDYPLGIFRLSLKAEKEGAVTGWLNLSSG